jgi:hypothetical protein
MGHLRRNVKILRVVAVRVKQKCCCAATLDTRALHPYLDTGLRAPKGTGRNPAPV